jgi:pre-mRNA-splicing factor ATP-dependent RNA helicase DHX16
MQCVRAHTHTPQVSEIKPEWLVEVAPHYYSKKDIADEGKKMPKGKGRSAGQA